MVGNFRNTKLFMFFVIWKKSHKFSDKKESGKKFSDLL